MDPLLLASLYLSFLDMFYVPVDKIKPKHFVNFHNPNIYYNEYIRREKSQEKRLFVNGVGEFRSALGVKDLKEKEYDYPVLDSVWASMSNLYNNSLAKDKTLPFLPFIPSVIDFLPSNQRHYYLLDVSLLPGSFSKADEKLCRMSFSIYYFPIGCAVSRIGLYLGAEGYLFEPKDLTPLLKRPEKHLKVRVSKKNRMIFQGYLFDMMKQMQKHFTQELCGSYEVQAKTLKRFSFADFVDTSRPLKVVADKGIIFKVVESTFTRPANAMPRNIGYPLKNSDGDYEDTIVIAGDKYGFIWVPKSVGFTDHLLYRRYLRNLAMLLIVQQSLYVQISAIESSRWRDQIRSNLFIKQIKQGVLGPVILTPLTLLHYVQIQKTFGKNILQLYEGLRESIDSDRTIDQTADKLQEYFQQVDQEVQASAGTVHGLISKFISLAKLP
jgi:hypothetical protein